MTIDDLKTKCGWDVILGFKDFGNGYCAAVVPMAYTERIIVMEDDDYSGYGRYWCFERGTGASALDAWKEFESEPLGWLKSWDQRRRRYNWMVRGSRLERITEESDENGAVWHELISPVRCAA
jgi:hypothetical protein